MVRRPNFGTFKLFLVLLLIIQVLQASHALNCNRLLSEVVEGRLNYDRTLSAVNYTFTEGFYERVNRTHFTVCICTVVTCVFGCCPKGEQYVSYQNKTCAPGGSSIFMNVTERNNEVHLVNLSERFHFIYIKPCDLAYPVAQTSNPKLFTNGTLTEDNDAPHDVGEFCVSIIGADSNLILSCAVNTQQDTVNFMYPIGMLISIPFLIATLLVYSIFSELQNLHGKCLMCHVSSMIVAYIFLASVQIHNFNPSTTVCYVFGHIIQMAFLSTFFWLNVMSFDIWWAFSGFKGIHRGGRRRERMKFLFYCLYSWGCCLVMLAVTLVLGLAPNIPDSIIKPALGNTKCFFETEMATLAYFYGPIAAILACNMLFFVATAYKIFVVKQQTKILINSESRTSTEDNKQRFFLYLKLFLVMGVNWIAEIISWAAPQYEALFWITDIFNSLQGIFIFWIFVLSQQARVVIRDSYRNSRLSRISWKSSRTTGTYLSTRSLGRSTQGKGDGIDINHSHILRETI